jgi:hypothetical protein
MVQSFQLICVDGHAVGRSILSRIRCTDFEPWAVTEPTAQYVAPFRRIDRMPRSRISGFGTNGGCRRQGRCHSRTARMPPLNTACDVALGVTDAPADSIMPRPRGRAADKIRGSTPCTWICTWRCGATPDRSDRARGAISTACAIGGRVAQLIFSIGVL